MYVTHQVLYEDPTFNTTKIDVVVSRSPKSLNVKVDGQMDIRIEIVPATSGRHASGGNYVCICTLN